jgi:hypothetical protein
MSINALLSSRMRLIGWIDLMLDYKGIRKHPVISAQELARNQRFIKNILELVDAYDADRRSPSNR